MSDDDDGLGWDGPECPECGQGLDVEPLSTMAGLVVAYVCSVHGAIEIERPLG
jgi:hypothetical protein